MKALVLEKVGQLEYREVPKPEPAAGEVLLRVMASGICGSDIARVFEKGTYSMPMIPGHEFSGVVESVGENVDAALIGRCAAVFPLIPCKKCRSCETGRYETCSAYNYYGSRCDGGFAEYAAVRAWNLVPIEESVSYECAAMMEPAAVAVHALRRGQISVGDTVGIAGAGPIGLMLASWAGIAGAGRVTLWDIDPGKVAFAKEMGFEAVNSAESDIVAFAKATTENEGFDLCVEGAGVAATLSQCILAARTGGRVVTMGNPAGDMRLDQKTYWEILRKQLALYGTWNSSYGAGADDWKEAARAMGEGKLNLARFITHRLRLSEGGAPFAMMRERKEFFNKIMFLP